MDSKQYGWVDINVVMGGKSLIGVTGIKYSEKQEKDYIYGKGAKPLAIQRKNVSYEGEITLLQSELEALIQDAKNKSILNVTLDTVTVGYVPDDGVPTTDQLLSVQFMESPKEMKQGDPNMEISLPIMFLDLKHNI